jgi:hypothetical protein
VSGENEVGLSGGQACWASAEIWQVVYAELRGERAQPVSSAGEESAQEATFAEFVEPGVPGFHADSEPFQDC